MKNKYFTLEERYKMQAFLQAKKSKKEIARLLDKSLATIYNELNRGRIDGKYYPLVSQKQMDRNVKKRGKRSKIYTDKKLASYISNFIRQKYSPDVISYFLKQNNRKITVCTKTIYNYISKNLLEVSYSDLKTKWKRKKMQEKREKKIPAFKKEKMINFRPDILDRKEFGHWEMDTVYSGKDTSKTCLFVLTERKTRYELIFKMPDRKSISCIKVLDFLEKKYKKNFFNIFKTITVDNGVEFSDFENMENSILYKKKRTIIYYCHPYSSFERGSNENANRMIRWFIKKGEDISKYTKKYIQKMQDFINNYPRKILNYDTAKKMFILSLSFI